MVSWQRNLIYFKGRPIGPLLFWFFILAIGVLAVYVATLFNNDWILMGCGTVVIVVSGLFSAGTLYLFIYGKNDYGDISDLK